MSNEKPAPAETKNSWVTPTIIGAIITAVVTLLTTFITLYFNYIQTTLPLEIAATQTAEARIFALTLAASVPTLTPSLPSTTPTLVPPTATFTLTPTLEPSLSPTATFTKTRTRTPAPTELKFCINTRSVYVRAGPGMGYAAMGGLSFEDCLFFDGRTEVDGLLWLRVSPEQELYLMLGGGWVRADLVRPQDFDQLPVIALPTATPTPEG